MSGKAKNAVGSVERTFAIVEAVKEFEGAGVTELANHLGIPKSTVHNYLSTLEQEEYLIKEDDTYYVGIRFLDFGAHARSRRRIYKIARPEVDRLAEQTGELANLLIEEHGRGIYLHRVGGDRAVHVEAQVGTRVHLHTTALGKTILAHLPKERVDGIIDRHGLLPSTPQTVTDPAELREELDRIRDQGYAMDDEEKLEGLRCVAAPIMSDDGRVLGAISVAGPMNRLRGDRFREELPNKILEVANVIELNITYA